MKTTIRFSALRCFLKHEKESGSCFFLYLMVSGVRGWGLYMSVRTASHFIVEDR